MSGDPGPRDEREGLAGGESRLGGRAGVILPAAILLLLGGTLLAASVLVTARSTVLLADGDRHLGRAFALRGPLRPAAPDGSGGRALRPGFVLLSRGTDAVDWSVWRVGATVDATVVAAGTMAAAETGDGVRDEGGELRGAGAEDGCPPEPMASHRYHRPREPLPEPALPHPGLGAVGVEELAGRAGEVAGSFASPDPALAVVVEPVVQGGEGSGLLVAPGDLVLRAGAVFRGLLLVRGDLVLDEDALVLGAVRVGGELRLRGGGRVLGCRDAVRARLSGISALEQPFPLAGGDFLGRH